MKKLLLVVAIFALSSADIISDSLALHNNERNAHGVPSLTWSTTLAASAQAYAQVMASTGTTSHSTNRVNVGENLAWGSGRNINVLFLGGLWINEKEFYIPGQNFPDCSTTGSWHDVAHYTQLMWEKTTEVGCGIAQSSSGRYNYVCQYSPQGNMDGQSVYTASSPITSSSSSSPSPSENNGENTFNSNEGTLTAEPVITEPFNPVITAPVINVPFTPVIVAPVTTQPVITPPATTVPIATAPPTTAPTTTISPSPNQPYTYSTSAPDASSSSFVSDCLYAHNHERNAYGIPSLTWSTSLAQTAQSYSQHMASTGSTSHSTGRVNVGENLAWQSGRGTNTEALANRWLNEKRYYIAGQDFPNVSTTGSWESVAHYTQMMWRKTTEVGCGVSEGDNGMYYYVCHYSVQGNIMGQPVY